MDKLPMRKPARAVAYIELIFSTIAVIVLPIVIILMLIGLFLPQEVVERSISEVHGNNTSLGQILGIGNRSDVIDNGNDTHANGTDPFGPGWPFDTDDFEFAFFRVGLIIFICYLFVEFILACVELHIARKLKLATTLGKNLQDAMENARTWRNVYIAITILSIIITLLYSLSSLVVGIVIRGIILFIGHKYLGELQMALDVKV